MKLLRVRKPRRQSKTAQDSKMCRDFFAHLPLEIVLNILLRLPIQTIMSCKCVCKPWLDFLTTSEFVKFHFSKAVPGHVIFERKINPKPFKFVEFVDDDDLNCREHHWNVVFNFDLPFHEPLHSSANGLLFLYKGGFPPGDLVLCNPITRDYITLPSPPFSKLIYRPETYGFGVSRMSGQYKVVRIFHVVLLQAPVEIIQYVCQVYTVGSGSWREIAPAGPFMYEGNAKGAFLNGNLHWVVCDFGGSSVSISCFDLETERFSTFSLPPPCRYKNVECLNVSALKGYLCLSDNSTDDGIVIWLMKDYGDEKSWTKEFVIRKNFPDYKGLVCPIEAFKNGEILIAMVHYDNLLNFLGRTDSNRHVDLFGLESGFYIYGVGYTPSFLPLKTYAMEKVSSF